jgi:hypothetical protein
MQPSATASVLLAFMGRSAFAATAGGDPAADFDAFVAQFGKSYDTPDERDVRYAIFKANHRVVQAENGKGLPYRLALNEFADLTSQEFRAGHLGFTGTSELTDAKPWGEIPHLGTDGLNSTATLADLPDAVDWVEQGAVTTPKNQLHCGSCWSFSTTGALEGAWQIATGELVSLSEQQFVDCDRADNACGGGHMDQAFQYAQESGICTEESYPYQARAGTCSTSSCTVAVPQGAVQGFRDVTPQDEQALMEAVSRQPVSIAIEADQQAFQLYSGGVLTHECGDRLDHGVLLVGYGTDNGVDYWKIKNSWGSAWGEGGFVRIQRGLSGSGQCGISLAPSYPVVDASDSGAAGATAAAAAVADIVV